MVIKTKMIILIILIFSLNTKIIYSEMTREEINQHLNAAEIFYSSGNYTSALYEFNLIKDIENMSKEKQINYYIKLAVCYKNLDIYDKSIEKLNNALEIDKFNPVIYLNLAEIFEKTGLYEEAIKNYNKVIELNYKDLFYVYYGLAKINQKSGLLSKAIEYYTKALTIKLEPEIYKKLSECYEAMHKFELSSSMLEKYILTKPTVENYMHLSFLFMIQKKYDKSIDLLNTAKNISSNQDEIDLHLATILFKKGDFEKSKKILNELLNKNPESGLLHFLKGFMLYFENENKNIIIKEMNKSIKFAKSEMLKNYAEYFLDFIKTKK